MRILSMTASFGRLEQAHLDLAPGLNLIQAPNESGKSTWCAFWLSMLYGMGPGETEPERWQPWSGAPLEGELVVDWQGQSVTIRRGPEGNVPFGAFSAVYTQTGDPVPNMTADNCGEMLTGVSRAVFARSALVQSGMLDVTSHRDLEQCLSAMLYSGEDGASLSAAETLLKERHSRSTTLSAKLEEELAETDRTLSLSRSCLDKIAGLEAQEQELERAKAMLNGELALHRQLARQSPDDRFAAADAELDRANRQLAALERDAARFGELPSEERLRRAQGDLQYLRALNDEIKNAEAALNEADENYVQAQRTLLECTSFTGMTDEEAAQKVQRDLAEYKSCAGAARNRNSNLLPAGGLIAAVVLLVVGFAAKLLPLMAVLAIAVLGGSLYLWHRNGQALERRRRRAQQILTRWSVSSPGELEDQLTRFRSLFRGAQNAAEQAKNARGAVNDFKARQENTRSALIDFVHTFAPEIHDLFGCSAALSKALNLDHNLALARERVRERMACLDDLAAEGSPTQEPESGLTAPRHSMQECRELLDRLEQELQKLSETLNQARGKQELLGDPAAITAQREKLARRLELVREEQTALTCAMEALKAADDRLRRRFSPELNRLAGEYFARLTGQAYQALTLDRELEGQALRAGDTISHSVFHLSGGTRAQSYLAVRLAICALCLPEKPPIVLDDAFLAFDDERLKYAMELVRELAETQQVLLFTCHSREGNILGEDGVNRLELN